MNLEYRVVLDLSGSEPASPTFANQEISDAQLQAGVDLRVAEGSVSPCQQRWSFSEGVILALAAGVFGATAASELPRLLVRGATDCREDCREFLTVLALSIIAAVGVIVVGRIAVNRMVQSCKNPAWHVLRREYNRQSQALQQTKTDWLFKEHPALKKTYQDAERSHSELWKVAVEAIKSNDRKVVIKAIANFSLCAGRANAQFTALAGDATKSD